MQFSRYAMRCGEAVLTAGLAAALAAVIIPGRPASAAETRRSLEYAPAPADNPLKGLVPYRGDKRDRFPHSMEFSYIPYSDLVKGYDVFDWEPLERILNDVAGRGHQAVFRVYLEYPGKPGAIPEFLIREGLKVHAYSRDDGPSSVQSQVQTPDYEDANLRRSLVRFIAALGAKYDGDPRIGFITAGLLGLWGEWHTHPRTELFASKTVQREVMDAYEAAFRTTPVLLRYPADDRDPRVAANCDRGFGYHDDSFAWATLATGRKEDAWFFMARLRAAGPAALSKWKTHPIGGEIRPEAWGRVFDERPGDERIQNFRRCVEETHVTWLMDSGMFGKERRADRIARAEEEVRRMGYEFHAPAVTIEQLQGGKVRVSLELENRGVAPFYYDWRAEWGLLADGRPIRLFPCGGTLHGLLPGDPPRVWTGVLDLSGTEPGTYTLAVRVPNPLKGGIPIRFANASQDVATGWLTLDEVRLP